MPQHTPELSRWRNPDTNPTPTPGTVAPMEYNARIAPRANARQEIFQNWPRGTSPSNYLTLTFDAAHVLLLGFAVDEVPSYTSLGLDECQIPTDDIFGATLITEYPYRSRDCNANSPRSHD